MTSTLSLQSSDMDMSTLLAIFPREIAYSQNTVGLTIYNGEEESVSVRSWVNGKPYTIPLDVIINDVGENCSFDNRRLYAARNHAPTEWHFMVKQHAFTDVIPPEKVETGAAYISFWWEMFDPASGEPEVHCFKGAVSYWGLMVAFRCACQSPSFSLNGSHAEPTVRQSPFSYPSYYKVDRIGCKQIPLLDDPIIALTSAIDRDQTVCFSRSDSSILMHRQDFIQLLLRHIEGVQVDSYGKYTRRQMVFRAKGEENDGLWPDDGELFRAEQQRIEDIDIFWMESDLAQVWQLQSAITTCLCYFPVSVAANSLVLADISRAMTSETGCPVLFRDLVECKSTVVVFDIYGDIDEHRLAVACGEVVGAVSVVDSMVSGEPDESQFVHMRPVWTHVATGLTPPEELSIRDTFEDVRVTQQRPSAPCGVLTRTGCPCKNRTKHSSGLCWRHRLGH